MSFAGYERIDERNLEDIYRSRRTFNSSYRHPRRSRGYVNGRRKNARKIGGLKGLYYKYYYLVGYLPKPVHRPLSPEMKEAMRMCDKYSACATLLGTNNIGTIEQLKSFIDKSRSEMDALSQERNKIYNRLRREKNPETIAELKAKRDSLTERICSIRKDLKLADFTLDRSKKIARDIQIEQKYCKGDHIRQRTRARTERDWER